MSEGEERFNATICGLGVSLDNPSWFSFIATSTTVTVTITPSNCRHTSSNIGMQGAIVSACPHPPGGGAYVTVGNCVAACMTGTFTIGDGGVFVVGQQYWIMLDGCAGDICDFEITATQGINLPVLTNPSMIEGPLTACVGDLVEFTVDEPQFASRFYWSVNGEEKITTCPKIKVPIVADMSTGVFELCLVNAENSSFSLVEDNNYDGSICLSVDVKPLPEVTELPDVAWCMEAGPYERDGFRFYPPSGLKTYVLSAENGCDSTLSFHLSFIKHEFPVDTLILCAEELPYQHPVFGWIDTPGDYSLFFTDQHGCDSATNLSIRTINFQFEIRLSTESFECGDDVITIDATRSRVMLSDGQRLWFLERAWYRDGAKLDVSGDYIEVTEPGEYKYVRQANYMGKVCTASYVFTLEDNRIAPAVPEIDSPQSGDEGDTITVSLTNWDGTSVISWQQGEGYEILSGQGTAEVSLRLVKELNDTICVSVHKQGCVLLSSEACEPITILGVNAVGEAGQTALLEVYPNPAADHIYISSPLQGRAELLSADGRVLRHVVLASPDRQMIRTGDLPAGVYSVRLVTGQAVHAVPVAIIR